MSLLKVAKALFLASAAALLTSCGFKPIYATPENGSAAVNRQIAIGIVEAPEAIKGFVIEALDRRIGANQVRQPKYELSVLVKERAQRLAVQIDATVTRYNYRLQAEYFLTDTTTGTRRRGKVEAVTSYNIVTSIFSTMFAEKTAQEKAARLLAEEIERELLLKYSGVYNVRKTEGEDTESTETETDEDAGKFLFIDGENTLFDGYRNQDSDSFFDSQRFENAVPDPIVDEGSESDADVSEPIVGETTDSDTD